MDELPFICALHQNPIDIHMGGGVRIAYLLSTLQKLSGMKVSLYTLGNDSEEREINGITERHIAKPFIFQRLTGGYICMLPYLLRRQLLKSNLQLLKPQITIMEGPFMGYATLKVLGFPRNSIKIYDAHNIESNYWHQYFDNKPFGNLVLKKIRALELYVSRNADYIFATSTEEMDIFENDFGIERKKLVLVPNGVNTENIKPTTKAEKNDFRNDFGISNSGQVIAFMGSNIKPNIEACRWIITYLAPRMSENTFVIIGSVAASISAHGKNVKLLGILPEKIKNNFICNSDIALNPVLSGAGTNVKMLEYLSAGLPVISTQAGARGISLENGQDAIITSLEYFEKSIHDISNSDSRRNSFTINARKRAIEYDWEKIGLDIMHRLGL